MSHVTPEVQTHAFLRMLDPATKDFAFRVLPEGGTTTIKPSNRKGRISDLRPTFEQLNRKGGGVFVTINEGGQRADEITRVRAVFADTDGAPLGPIKETLTPHIIAESSPSKWHVYWLVTPDFPLDQFSAVQTAIAQKFGTDPIVKDLPRVMRVPGFYHKKREPFLCRLVDLHSKLDRYSLDEIVNGLGLSLNKTVKDHKALGQNAGAKQRADFAEVERALAYLSPFVPRDQWLGPILALAHDFGEDGRTLAHRWSRGDLWKGGRDGHA